MSLQTSFSPYFLSHAIAIPIRRNKRYMALNYSRVFLSAAQAKTPGLYNLESIDYFQGSVYLQSMTS
ncbi:MAG: hypothetical protein AB1782_19945 [Cyanobacteriota bacterium]